MPKQWDLELASVDMHAAAREYRARGWAVLPLWWCSDVGVCACPAGGRCSSPGKHPLTATGLKEASKSGLQIDIWWDRWPRANVGILTGELSGIIVLDVDGPTGRASLVRLRLYDGRESARTVTAETGGGGLHILWAWEPGHRNRARIEPGIDVRADGGYIVAPPSLHASGARYRWLDGLDPAAVELAQVPAWFSRVALKPKLRASSTDRGGAKPLIDLASVGPIANGERNSELFRIGCRMVWEGRSPSEVLEGLHFINARSCQPPLGSEPGDSVGEILQIAQSCERYR